MTKAKGNTTEEYEDMNMITEYFARTVEYQEKYGPQTMVLMQCGTFYEVYAYQDPENPEPYTYKGGPIYDFSQICRMAISTKTNVKYKGQSVYMAGFQHYQIDKHVQTLIQNQYTVVEIIQEDEMQTNGKKKIRRVKGIYSLGTHMTYENQGAGAAGPQSSAQWSNYIMCVWVHAFRTQYFIGIALLNTYTGQSSLMEHNLPDEKLQSTSFDDLDKYMAIYSPREIILVCDEPLQPIFIMHLNHHHTHEKVPIIKYSLELDIVQHATEQIYRRQILTNYFGQESFSQCAEFSQYELATQSFCMLMHFLEERNPNLCKHIQMPIWENASTAMILANHTLQQLNILEDSHMVASYAMNQVESQSLHSVHSWTNKCITMMGKRAFREHLTHPTFDSVWLQREYDAIYQLQQCEQTHPIIDPIRKQMRQIQDIHKMSRQMVASRMYPSGLEKLYSSICACEHVLDFFETRPKEDMKWMYGYLNISSWAAMQREIRRLRRFLDERLYMDRCARNQSTTSFDPPIIKKGFYQELDTLYEEYERSQAQLKTIHMFLERQMSPHSKLGEYVKLNITEKTNHHSLQMTIKRCETLQEKMKSYSKGPIILDNEVDFQWSEVSFVPCATKTQREIHFPLCERICRSLEQFQGRMNQMTQELFMSILQEVEKEHMETLEACCRSISLVDVLVNKCYIARKYDYVIPTLDVSEHPSKPSKPYVEAKGLRHILIEQIQQTELYVPNDICIGKDSLNGMLLFGANTSGKTSNMRALGIAVVMAQAGMCVPCASLKYKPYESLYSRIINQDNLFKGLSTFAVEMSELRTILKYANESSLVLGDELCSGTETISALSIMMSSLIQLDAKECSFMFTTHFHEIVDFSEMQALSKVQCFHLEIKYNAETGKMEYDRILKPGSGPPSYGLEVCQSLYMDPVFLSKAYEIRSTYFPGEYEGSLHLSKSRYNAKKLKGKCEICGKMSDEIHHIHPQKDANAQGMVKPGIHKNNPANLMALCEGCHERVHHPNPNFNVNSRPHSPETISRLSDDSTSISAPTVSVSVSDPVKKTKKIVKRRIKKTEI